MIVVQRDPYPQRPLFHRGMTLEPLLPPNPYYDPGLHGLGLMIVQDDDGRTTGIIRKFESPYHAWRHYNRPLWGVGSFEPGSTEQTVLLAVGVLAIGLIAIGAGMLYSSKKSEPSVGSPKRGHWEPDPLPAHVRYLPPEQTASMVREYHWVED